MRQLRPRECERVEGLRGEDCSSAPTRSAKPGAPVLVKRGIKARAPAEPLAAAAPCAFGSGRTWLFYSASFVPEGCRTYANAVNPVGSKTVLVTDCDSEFGFSLAKHLHSKGFLVFNGCLMKDKGDDRVKELDSLKSDQLRTIQLNVCKSKEVEEAVEIVRSSLEDPEKGMWGLVNDVGVFMFGDVELTSMETYKEVADVNLWGTVRTTKAFLPFIRRAKGRIVNISSLLGRVVYAAHSSYCSSKFGVEAFSDCLRYEMHPLGAKVSVAEPSNYIAATSICSPKRAQVIANKMWDELPEVVRKDYGKKCFDEKIAVVETNLIAGSTDTSPVINAVIHALTAASPSIRYYSMDYYSWLQMQIIPHLPGAISDRLYRHYSVLGT